MASALRGSVAQTLQIVNKTLTQQRASVISGPPKYKVPMQEKIGLGALMVAAVCLPAGFIMANLDKFRNSGEQQPEC